MFNTPPCDFNLEYWHLDMKEYCAANNNEKYNWTVVDADVDSGFYTKHDANRFIESLRRNRRIWIENRNQHLQNGKKSFLEITEHMKLLHDYQTKTHEAKYDKGTIKIKLEPLYESLCFITKENPQHYNYMIWINGEPQHYQGIWRVKTRDKQPVYIEYTHNRWYLGPTIFMPDKAIWKYIDATDYNNIKETDVLTWFTKIPTGQATRIANDTEYLKKCHVDSEKIVWIRMKYG